LKYLLLTADYFLIYYNLVKYARERQDAPTPAGNKKKEGNSKEKGREHVKGKLK
jgi:hypothetical protein